MTYFVERVLGSGAENKKQELAEVILMHTMALCVALRNDTLDIIIQTWIPPERKSGR